MARTQGDDLNAESPDAPKSDEIEEIDSRTAQRSRRWSKYEEDMKVSNGEFALFNIQ
jgi:hypothetical protein